MSLRALRFLLQDTDSLPLELAQGVLVGVIGLCIVARHKMKLLILGPHA